MCVTLWQCGSGSVVDLPWAHDTFCHLCSVRCLGGFKVVAHDQQFGKLFAAGHLFAAEVHCDFRVSCWFDDARQTDSLIEGPQFPIPPCHVLCAGKEGVLNIVTHGLEYRCAKNQVIHKVGACGSIFSCGSSWGVVSFVYFFEKFRKSVKRGRKLRKYG